MAETLVGRNYTPLDHLAKVTGRARYAEDFRAEGMLFCKLLTSPMPHARVVSVDATEALAMPGVEGSARGSHLFTTMSSRLLRRRPSAPASARSSARSCS